MAKGIIVRRYTPPGTTLKINKKTSIYCGVLEVL
jgi:hypothetical protein